MTSVRVRCCSAASGRPARGCYLPIECGPSTARSSELVTRLGCEMAAVLWRLRWLLPSFDRRLMATAHHNLGPGTECCCPHSTCCDKR